MIFLYVLLTVYILAINFYSFRLLKTQQEAWDGGEKIGKNDGKLILAALLGGATAIYVTMFILRFRLSNLLFMILMPLIAVVNFYCFFVGFRGIYYFTII